MHFSNLLLASAITLAPAVYGYGVATVELSFHEGCNNGEAPHDSVKDSEDTVATEDTCTQMPAKHSFEIDAYSFAATPITKDTTSICHAVGVYSNDECVGLPITVIPLFPGEHEDKTPCIRDDYFGERVSVKLFCEDKKDKGHEHEDHEEHGPKKHEDGGEDEDEGHEEAEGAKNREAQAQAPAVGPGALGGLGGFLGGLPL
ncbi:hypothetical protein BDW74DRAFT_89477 [Aspergillus multicolor]|uniref:protein ccpA n=1 Tax=Aspergillus multicolor TaxID=41759 RepID=UPI003CCD849A